MFNISRMRLAEATDPTAQQAGAPSEDPKPSGFVDIGAAYEQIGNYMKNPHGYSFDVKAESKNGIHTFTITVKPTDMMQKAEQNGAVQPPAAPQGKPEAATAPETAGVPQGASAMSAAKNLKTALREYPDEFLKSIGL